MVELTKQTKRQIQRLMEEPSWQGIEAFYQNFLMKYFVEGSAKRASEFETIWYVAEREGGKRFLAQFMRELEEAAHQANEK